MARPRRAERLKQEQTASPLSPEQGGEVLVHLFSYPTYNVLDLLLRDKTTKENITLATDAYTVLDASLTATTQLTLELLTRWGERLIVPRVFRSVEQQEERTRRKAEVFTPSWICNRMNNACDAEWFGQDGVFNSERQTTEGTVWEVNEENLPFTPERPWQAYVDSRRLEITCGEAPYLVSRYDAATGQRIPLEKRIGILDRKLRAVNENAETEEEWHRWVLRAFRSVYGYEFQGDNVLVARINLLHTYVDYVRERWHREPTVSELTRISNVIVWNIWQMDGLAGTVVRGTTEESLRQPHFADFDEEPEHAAEEAPPQLHCKIFDWRSRVPRLFQTLKKSYMKFDFAIGNPPYQESRDTTKDMPIYHEFMDATYQVADRALLITPARFLFNAGATPKPWNRAMLNDAHFKVLEYESDSSRLFSHVDIKGGVAIHYRDSDREFGAIGHFTPHRELRMLRDRMQAVKDFCSLSSIMYPYSVYTLSDGLWQDFPKMKAEVEFVAKNRNKLSAEQKRGRLSNLRIITTNIFDLLPDLFFDEAPDDGREYVCLMGRRNNARCSKYIRAEYIDTGDNFARWKVLIPKSNGSGTLGETLSHPLVVPPQVGYTQSFLGIGSQETEAEARAIYQYICTKFCRVLLGILKITQDNPPEKWAYVPMQDFSAASDIDWSQSVADIDRQLYRKYDLSKEEQVFIERMGKEMP